MTANRAIAAQRDSMVAQWTQWLGDRMSGSKSVPRAAIERGFGLMVDVLREMVGPYRREANSLWRKVTEHYGRSAAARGLAAGEVVEEMQYLRELLIRHLAPDIAAMRPRQGMALLLRLNRIVDMGVAMAVVGYTDALVSAMLPGDQGAEPPTNLYDAGDVGREFDRLASELAQVAVTG